MCFKSPTVMLFVEEFGGFAYSLKKNYEIIDLYVICIKDLLIFLMSRMV